jgi:hypothetical protein
MEECLTCHKPIKLSKIDNAGPNARKKWERFELDGVTPHQCKKQEQDERQEPIPKPPVQQVDNSPQIAELSKQIAEQREILNKVLAHVQALSPVVVKNKK